MAQIVRVATQKSLLDNPVTNFAEGVNTTTIDNNDYLIPYNTTVLWVQYDNGSVFSHRIFCNEYRSQTYYDIIAFLENGGSVEGGDDIDVPNGRTLLDI